MFKYHPDNVIYENYRFQCKFADFVLENPNFPIVKGKFFEYNNGTMELINSVGHHAEVSVSDYQDLVDLIEAKSYGFPVPPPPEPEV